MEELHSTILESDLQDPSLLKGGKIIFDRLLPLYSEENQSKDPEMFRIRMILYPSNETFERFRIEISSEADIFLFFKSEFDNDSFNSYKGQMGLTCEFHDFPGQVIKLLSKESNKDGEKYCIFLQAISENECTLIFKQVLMIKKVDLFEIRFTPDTDEFLKSQIQYRYDMARAELKREQSQKADLLKIIKVKDPAQIKGTRMTKQTGSPKSGY